MTVEQVSKLKNFYRRFKRMPSYREIGRLMGYHSTNAAYKLIKKLHEAGFVRSDETGRIIPSRRFFEDVRVLGTVEAGWPSPAEEELSDTMSLDEFLIENKEATFMLKVSGDSMRDAGIMPGDMVLAERGREPKNGDIVVAEVDHAWTMKYFVKKGRNVVLFPANKKYKPIIPKEELNIAAVITAVIRKY